MAANTQASDLMTIRGAAPAPAPAMAARPFGRFMLTRLLGRSSATMAWLATDTRARQEVMVIMPRKPPVTRAGLEAWIEGARRAARLQHPRLLAAQEVAHHEGWPYQVFERQQGSATLSEILSARAQHAPLDVAAWCVDALEGLAYAHDAAVAHGDIGLHTLVLDKQGRAQLWGLACAVLAGAADAAGLDPSVLREHRAASDRDVLSIGLVLHSLLANAPALDEPDVPSVINRVIGQEIVRLPWSLPQPVPEALRAIVNRATDRHEKRRYLSARSFERALSGWRKVEAQESGGAIALLVDRLHSVGHLPARAGLAQRVVQVVRMENQRIDDLADVILQDAALSFELLRMVNSVQYGGQRETAVTTVRRALQLLGVSGLRRAASAVRPWPGPLKEEGARALDVGFKVAAWAGHIAEELAPAGLDAESALLAAQLQHLGKLLALYHFPEEAQQILQLMEPQPPVNPGEPVTPGLNETAAAMAVLGVDLPSLAMAVAKHWGLDESMQEMMQPLPRDRTVRSPDSVTAWLRLVASCANETLEAARQGGPAQAKALNLVAGRYAKTLDYNVDALKEAVQKAKLKLAKHGASRPASA